MSTDSDFDDLIFRCREEFGREDETSTEDLGRDCPEMAEVLENERAAQELMRLGVANIAVPDLSPDRFGPGALAAGSRARARLSAGGPDRRGGLG